MQELPGKRRRFGAVVLIAVLAVAALALYAAVTYPKTVVSFPVSFIFGADVENREFEMSPLHGRAQVEVIVSSGTALWWNATIKHQDETIWNDHRSQGDQMTYKSGWIELSSGHYNFTFRIAGGSLEAEVKVTTKGGFW